MEFNLKTGAAINESSNYCLVNTGSNRYAASLLIPSSVGTNAALSSPVGTNALEYVENVGERPSIRSAILHVPESWFVPILVKQNVVNHARLATDVVKTHVHTGDVRNDVANYVIVVRSPAEILVPTVVAVGSVLSSATRPLVKNHVQYVSLVAILVQACVAKSVQAV